MKTELDKLRNGLIVSCQASIGWPLYGSEYMVQMAIAAKEGGAIAVRANEPTDIKAIKQAVDLPVIGVNKIYLKPPTVADVCITPTFKAAKEIIEAGCDILAMDSTARGRGYKEVQVIVDEIKKTLSGYYTDG